MAKDKLSKYFEEAVMCAWCGEENNWGRFIDLDSFGEKHKKAAEADRVADGNFRCTVCSKKRMNRKKREATKRNKKKQTEQNKKTEQRLDHVEKGLNKHEERITEGENKIDKLEKKPILNQQLIKKVMDHWKYFTKKKNFISGAENWWIKLGPQEREKISNEVKDYDEFKKVSQEIEEKRNFTLPLYFLAIFFFIFVGWDKFWAWYKKPIKQEWDWDDDNDEEEEEEIEPASVEPVEPSLKLTPEKGWRRIKNLVLDNKVKTSCLLGIIGSLVWLIWKIWVLYNR